MSLKYLTFADHTVRQLYKPFWERIGFLEASRFVAIEEDAPHFVLAITNDIQTVLSKDIINKRQLKIAQGHGLQGF